MLLARGRRSFPDLHSQSRSISLFSVELCQDGNGEFRLWDLCFVTVIPFPQECHCLGHRTSFGEGISSDGEGL